MKLLNLTIILLIIPLVMNGINLNPKFKEVNEVGDSIKQVVKFLNINQGVISILDETYEPYFSNLQIREIHALTGSLPPTNNLEEARNFAREKFSSAVTSFTEDDKEVIRYTISKINETLYANNLELIANHPWKFIKIENWLCGGFAHTRGDYIILSQRHIQHLSKSWSKNMTHKDSVDVVNKLGSLLVHEQMHCLQRKYPEIFESLYTKLWNFEKAEVKIDSSILVNQLINPDAPRPEWITCYNGNYFWIRTLINANSVELQMGKDFIDVVFTLEKQNGRFTLAKDSLNHPISKRLNEYSSYVNSFPVAHGLDHPNEISAYMFSVYFTSIFEQTIPFENSNPNSLEFTKGYLFWLKDNL